MDLEDIGKKLDGIDSKIELSLTWQARHEAEAEQRQRDLNEVRHTLFGNDVPGLKTRVDRQERFCANHQKEEAARLKLHTGAWRWFMEVLRVVVAAVVIAVIFWAMQVYRAT